MWIVRALAGSSPLKRWHNPRLRYFRQGAGDEGGISNLYPWRR
jgi:hypothetical protein